MLGLGTPHTPIHVVDRPSGFPAYVVMCFANSFITRTRHGMEEGKAGDCIIHDAAFPQWCSTPPGRKQGFRNDWVHMAGDGVDELMRRYKLNFNEIIPTGRSAVLSPVLTAMQQELFAREPYNEEAISLLAAQLFLTIARYSALYETFQQYSTAERGHYANFLEFRRHIANEYATPWTIDTMAQNMSLSKNRFSVLYKQFFGVSPIEDVIAMRVGQAKRALIHTNESVSQIAASCGFSTVYYFCRVFKRHTDCTPSSFRRSMH